MLEEDADHQSENASNNQEGTFPPLDLPQLTTEPRADKVCASKASVKMRDVSCTGSLPVTTDNNMPVNHQPSPMKSVHLIPDLINRLISAERSPNFQHVHNDKIRTKSLHTCKCNRFSSLGTNHHSEKQDAKQTK